jgi:hypothetical protein
MENGWKWIKNNYGVNKIHNKMLNLFKPPSTINLNKKIYGNFSPRNDTLAWAIPLRHTATRTTKQPNNNNNKNDDDEEVEEIIEIALKWWGDS